MLYAKNVVKQRQINYEVFCKFSVGPLTTLKSGKKYTIITLVILSKYPEPPAVTEISSPSLIDAFFKYLDASAVLSVFKLKYAFLLQCTESGIFLTFATVSGSFLPLRLLFRLKNAPYFFNKVIFKLLKDHESFASPYFEDTVVFPKTWEDHIEGICFMQNKQSQFAP
ncbi:hypothetical protein CEXT_521 [Caerostris extrusa]|uniref:Uncharacterized protein n=1 Tax=Caerostris extrusa TaxID=172846 RepID=A0AAV4S9E6_CAEEX|nr:hypothetical protein CEXT_521 [Caerostris extrusa]